MPWGRDFFNEAERRVNAVCAAVHVSEPSLCSVWGQAAVRACAFIAELCKKMGNVKNYAQVLRYSHTGIRLPFCI